MSTGIPTKALDTRPPKLIILRIDFILGLSGVSELYPLSIANPSSRVCVGIPMPQQHHGLSTPVRGSSREIGGVEERRRGWSEVDGGMLHKTQQELVQIEQQR
eukprot:jgi/Picre1/27262/NNA_000231.t1